MNTKRKYVKPSTETIALQHNTMLLTGSRANSSINGWGDGGTYNEDIFF